MKYLKYIGYYLLFLVLIIFICSLLNLIGVNSTITNFILLLSNILSFSYFGYKNGKSSKEKGYLAGIKISLLLLINLVIITLIISHKLFSISSLIYYLILLLTGIFGGMIGINKKEDNQSIATKR